MKRKEQLGIVIFDDGVRNKSQEFGMVVANGTRKDDLFVTSPLIRKTIKENRLTEGTDIGRIETQIASGVLTFRTYYPIGEGGTKSSRIFQGTETARYIESKILKKLKKYHTIKKVRNYNPLPARIHQQEKLGYNKEQILKGLNFSTYYKKLRTKTAKIIRKTMHRIK